MQSSANSLAVEPGDMYSGSSFMNSRNSRGPKALPCGTPDRSSSPDIKNHYKRFRAHVQKTIRDAYWKHTSNIFTLEPENTYPDSPRKNEIAKMFWRWVKLADSFGSKCYFGWSGYSGQQFLLLRLVRLLRLTSPS